MANNKKKQNRTIATPVVKTEEVAVTVQEAIEKPTVRKSKKYRKPVKQVTNALTKQDEQDLRDLEVANMAISNGETVMVTVSVVNKEPLHKRFANWFKTTWLGKKIFK